MVAMTGIIAKVIALKLTVMMTRLMAVETMVVTKSGMEEVMVVAGTINRHKSCVCSGRGGGGVAQDLCGVTGRV